MKSRLEESHRDKLAAWRQLVAARQELTEAQGGDDPKSLAEASLQFRKAEQQLQAAEDRHGEAWWEDLARRFESLYQQLDEVRARQVELRDQKSGLAADLAGAKEQLEGAEVRTRELQSWAKGIELEPPQQDLQSKVQGATAQVEKSKKHIDEISTELRRVESELTDAAAREKLLLRRIHEALEVARSPLAIVEGPLHEIRRRLDEDADLIADRAGMEALLADLEQGFVGKVGRGLHTRVVRYLVQDVVVYFWVDTGQVATHVVFEARSEEHRWPGSVPRVLFSDRDIRRQLVEQRKLAAIERGGDPSRRQPPRQ